jgi:hypothetical protein
MLTDCMQGTLRSKPRDGTTARTAWGTETKNTVGVMRRRGSLGIPVSASFVLVGCRFCFFFWPLMEIAARVSIC